MEVLFSSENLCESVDMQGFKLFSSSNAIEEKTWGLTNRIIKASFSDFQCNDFNIFRTLVKSEENCKITIDSSDKSCICIGMPISGAVNYRYNKVKGQHNESVWQKGFTNIVFSAEVGGYSRFGKKQPLDMIEILLSPDYFKKISESYPDLFETAYNRMSRGESFLFSPENIPANPLQMQTFKDIIDAKMMGNAAKMYIESKILENLSLFVYNTQKASSGNRQLISESDRSKMYQVRDIIHEQYQDIPSLKQLALMVGSNECKLKSAFKNIFGTTVFGYLFDYRMALASQFLLDTKLTIQEIALLVGYEHQSHFCSAFKRRFLSTPIEYRKNK